MKQLLVFILLCVMTSCSYKMYEHDAVYENGKFRRITEDKPLQLHNGDSLKVITKH